MRRYVPGGAGKAESGAATLFYMAQGRSAGTPEKSRKSLIERAFREPSFIPSIHREPQYVVAGKNFVTRP
jgi:hypothetical protein